MSTPAAEPVADCHGHAYLCFTRAGSRINEKGEIMPKTVVESQCSLGLLWVAGWLFSLGFLQLGFWKGLVAILFWPYLLGSGLVSG